MTKFVSVHIAKKIKDKGFKELCIAYYSKDVLHFNGGQLGILSLKNLCRSYNSWSATNELYPCYCNFVDAPTISQVLEWLRESKKTFIRFDLSRNGWFFMVKCMKTGYEVDGTMLGYFKSFNEAGFAGIEYVLDNLL